MCDSHHPTLASHQAFDDVAKKHARVRRQLLPPPPLQLRLRLREQDEQDE